MSTDNSGKVHMALDDIIKQGKMERRGENKNRSRFGKLDKRRIGDNGIRRRSDKDENRQMSSTRLSITNLHRDIVNSELRVRNLFNKENLF